MDKVQKKRTSKLNSSHVPKKKVEKNEPSERVKLSRKMDRISRFYKQYKFYFGVAAVAATAALSAHYLYYVAEKPQVFYKKKEGSVVSKIVSKLDILNEYYYPTFWCVCNWFQMKQNRIERLIT